MACGLPLQPNQTQATITSNPPGATISGTDFSGTAPQILIYTLNKGQATASAPITVTWVSGATTTRELKLVAGKSLNYVIQRPDVPGIDTDVKWAIHLQEKKASDDAVFYGGLAKAAENFNDAMKKANSNQPTHCKSTYNPYTKTVDTNCD